MERQDWERLARPVVAGIVVLVTLLLVVGLAIRSPQPHDVAVGVSGPAGALDPLIAGFGQNAPGAFAFTKYATADEARAAIDDRAVVAALIIEPSGPRLVVAGGAGEAVVGGVTAALSAAFKAQGTELAIETVHPFPAGDAHGIILFFLVLATLIASVAAGALSSLGLPGRSWVAVAGVLATFAVAAGVVGVLTAAWLADGYGDGTLALIGVATLLAFAASAVVAACARWAGAPGVGLAALVIVLLGIVSAGGPLGSSFLPDAYRAIAPWLPVAPAYSAMRGALAFGGVGVVEPALVLSAWALAGLIALAARDATLGRFQARANPVPA